MADMKVMRIISGVLRRENRIRNDRLRRDLNIDCMNRQQEYQS